MATPPKGRSDKGPAIVSKPYCSIPSEFPFYDKSS